MASETPSEEPVETCPWCREGKPLSEWYGKDPAGWDCSNGPVVCAECRRDPPDRDSTLGRLPVNHRQILKSLMAGKTFYQAARDAGVSPSYPGNMLRARDRSGKELRKAFNLLLEMEGLDVFSIARQTRILFSAKKPQWNPKAERWDWFADNATQLGLLRHLTKLVDLDPPKDSGPQAPAVTVNIDTNLGGEGPGDAPGTYTIEVQPEPPKPGPKPPEDQSP